jgi:hypothetical protein
VTKENLLWLAIIVCVLLLVILMSKIKPKGDE